MGKPEVAAERIVAEDDVAALFGLELEPAPGSKDADTGLKSGISGRTKLATPFNRPPAKEPIPLNNNSTSTKPTPTRSKDGKTFQVSSGARPQTTDANANRAEARNRAREDEISDSNLVAQKSAKAGRCGKRTGCATIGTEIPSWRSNNCREMDEVEKAEGPQFLSVGPVPEIPKSGIVQLGPEPKERDPAFRRRAPV